MILDAFLLLADEQTPTNGGSTSYIDTLAAGDMNVGDWFVVRVDAAFTTSDDTCKFELITDSTTAFTSPSCITLISSTHLFSALVTADKYMVKVRIPPGTLRYIRGQYSIKADAISAAAATVDMFIVKDADINALIAQDT